jgi:signal transduction histidine kinase
LAQWVGFSNGLAASMMFIRTIRGIWGELLPFATNPPSIPVWVGVLLVTTINGIGFLLLIKQHDDEKLRQALVDLTVAEEEQRQLLSLASHEFRTPAAIIKSSLDSLNFLSQDIPPQVAQRLVNIHKATQRMTHLANTLIAQDRLRHLRFDLIHGDVELSTLIKDVAATYITPLVLRGIEQDITIQADADMLAIALHNLIDNALRHSPGEHPPEIHLCHQDGCVEIRVADQGRGIQDQEKQAIFERFYRRDTDPGSGLGLSIVHKIVSLHRGTVSVQDNQPQGAVFVVRLPL